MIDMCPWINIMYPSYYSFIPMKSKLTIILNIFSIHLADRIQRIQVINEERNGMIYNNMYQSLRRLYLYSYEMMT